MINNVGIQSPFELDEVFASVDLLNASIATSADYERSTQVNGETISHIVDPRTGKSIRTDLASVSVISESAEKADVFATALFVLGLEEGLKLAEGNPQIEAVFISHSGEMTFTPGAEVLRPISSL